MANLKLNDLRTYLKSKSNDELIKEIVELTKQFPAVKEFYGVKLNPNSEKEVFEKYKKIIENEFFPDRGFGKMRYSKVNKAISDFKKVSNKVNLIAELMFFYAKIGVDFTNEYGDIDDQFYYAIERAYLNALEYIFKNNLQEQYKDKANKVCIEAEGIGWGFTDSMNEIYFDFYSEFEDEED